MGTSNVREGSPDWAPASEVLAASQRLTTPTGISPDLHSPVSSSRSSVAFSSDGLLAFPYALPGSGTTPQGVETHLALAPVVGTSEVHPTILPLPVRENGNSSWYFVATEFSVDSRCLLAIVEPEGNDESSRSHPAGPGRVCIWSRSAASRAANEGWNLSGSWPLATDGATQLGSSISQATWLPSSEWKREAIFSSAASDQVVEPKVPSAVLPGDAKDNTASSKTAARKATLLRRGPRLFRKGAVSPQCAVLIGTDGMVSYECWF